MPADAYVMDADMKKVADAIRTKGGTTAPLTFPNGMVQAVNDIQAGGGHEVEDGFITGLIAGDYNNNRVTALRAYAFSNCSKLTSVTLPNVTSTGMNSFSNCSKLTSVTLPMLKNIPGNTFNGDISLTTVNLPSAKWIYSWAIAGCNNLTTISLPSLEGANEYAFGSCRNLAVVKLGMNKVASGGRDLFFGTDTAQIYVPDNLVDQYKVATNWSQYASRIHPMSEAPPE